jgi:hypothetical protein
VVLILVAFVASWITMLSASGLPVAQMPVADAAATLWPVLLPLLACVLAPWALGQVRHT